KSLAGNVVRPKAIPAEFASMIDVYLAFLQRAADARRTGKAHLRGHLRPGPTPDNFPLIVSSPTGFQPLGAHGIGILLSGIIPQGRANTAGGRRPLIVREGGLNED